MDNPKRYLSDFKDGELIGLFCKGGHPIVSWQMDNGGHDNDLREWYLLRCSCCGPEGCYEIETK